MFLCFFCFFSAFYLVFFVSFSRYLSSSVSNRLSDETNQSHTPEASNECVTHPQPERMVHVRFEDRHKCHVSYREIAPNHYSRQP